MVKLSRPKHKGQAHVRDAGVKLVSARWSVGAANVAGGNVGRPTDKGRADRARSAPFFVRRFTGSGTARVVRAGDLGEERSGRRETQMTWR